MTVLHYFVGRTGLPSTLRGFRAMFVILMVLLEIHQLFVLMLLLYLVAVNMASTRRGFRAILLILKVLFEIQQTFALMHQ